MANGLLDFFGKDYEDPRTQGLLQFGLGLMQAGGYQDRPVSLGQAIGAGGRQGMQAYQQAVAEKQKKEQIAAQKSMQDLQMKKILQDMETQKQQQELAKKQNERIASQRSLVMQGLQTSGATGLALPRDRAGERPIETQLALAMAMGEDPTKALAYLSESEARRRQATKEEQEIKKGDIDIAQSQEVAVPLPLFTSPVEKDGILGIQNFRFVPKYGEKGEVTGYDEVEVGAFVPEAGQNIEADGRIIDKATGRYLGRSTTIGGKVKLLTDDNKIIDLTPDTYTKLDDQYWLKQQAGEKEMGNRVREIEEQRTTIVQLNDYLKTTQEAGQNGYELIANQVTGAIKSFFGEELTQAELNAARQSGQLNALIGRIRESVVGGGVMTEQDALRVISALGGDVSAWRSPQTVQAAITDVLQTKQSALNAEIAIYNRAVDFAPKGVYQRIGEAPDVSAIATPVAPVATSEPAPEPNKNLTADQILDIYEDVE